MKFLMNDDVYLKKKKNTGVLVNSIRIGYHDLTVREQLENVTSLHK